MNIKYLKNTFIKKLCMMLFLTLHQTLCQETHREEYENQQLEAETLTNPHCEPLHPPQCGYSMAVHDKVVGGNPSALGAWPWIALLGYSTSSEFVNFRCGGALISRRHVITAAHCVLDELILVRLGEQDLNSDNDGANPVDVLIEKATIHPKFYDDTLRNDIAILKLSNDVEFTDAVYPICLPLSDDLKNRNYIGTYPFVAGWGKTFFNSTKNNILREVQLPVVSNEKCKAAYRNIEYADITENVMCAGYIQGGKDACQGDSGNPFMFPIGSDFYLIGVVSGGFECARPGFYGIYTRVSSYLNFIESNMN